ncbi:MAG: DnaD domain protein [Oscillospiraceae bacterium]
MNINYGTSVFVVPAVVNDYLDSATSEQLKVILYLLQFPEKSVEAIATNLQLTEEQVETALQFWKSKDVLQPIDGIKMPPSEIAREMEISPNFRKLIQEAESIFGESPNDSEQKTLLFLYKSWHFSNESICMMLEYCKKHELHINYAKTTMIDWYNQGITSTEQVARQIDILERRFTFTGKIRKMFELYRKPTKKQQAFIDKWEMEGHSIEMMEYAYEQTVEQTNTNQKLSFEYIDAILQNCAENHLTTPEQAEQYHKDHPVSYQKSSSKKSPAPMSEQEIEEMNEYLSYRFEKED